MLSTQIIGALPPGHTALRLTRSVSLKIDSFSCVPKFRSFLILNTSTFREAYGPVKGGTFEGPKRKGKVRAFGADWVVRLDSVTTKLDVRLLLETEDGQVISNSYTGIVCNNANGTTYWRIMPLFETTSKKYEWLNYLIAVGVGDFIEGGVSYEVFAIK